MTRSELLLGSAGSVSEHGYPRTTVAYESARLPAAALAADAGPPTGLGTREPGRELGPELCECARRLRQPAHPRPPRLRSAREQTVHTALINTTISNSPESVA